MRRDQVDLDPLSMVAYGHYGRPVLVFPSEQGRA
jgi:esterase/lipase superfamily enzyme